MGGKEEWGIRGGGLENQKRGEEGGREGVLTCWCASWWLSARKRPISAGNLRPEATSRTVWLPSVACTLSEGREGGREGERGGFE